MRFISHWHLIAVVGASLCTAFTQSPLQADGTWTSPTTAPPQQLPGDDDSPSPVVTKPVATSPQQSTTGRPATSKPARPIQRAAAPVITPLLLDPQVTNQTQQALSFYGGYSARATLSRLPRRAPLQAAAAQPMRSHAKPFETIHHEPTVSPYLNLYREENLESIPNYFAFVRPQMEQLEANRLQQREIRQLRGKLQNAPSTVAAPRYQTGGVAPPGSAARYMDTAQFYGGWRR